MIEMQRTRRVFIGQKAMMLNEFPGYGRQAVNEFGSQFDGERRLRIVNGEDASAWARTSFETTYGLAGPGEDSGGRKARHSSANDDNVVFSALHDVVVRAIRIPLVVRNRTKQTKTCIAIPLRRMENRAMHPRLTVLAMVVASLALAQPSAPVRFETGSIRIHPMTPGSWLIKNFAHQPPFVIPTGPHFTDTGHVEDLIMEAWGVSEYQILYLPAWARSRTGYVFDVDARAAGNSPPSPERFQQMLQSLLAEQLHLKTHRETKRLSLYALVPDKGGPRFHEFRQPDAGKTPAPREGTTLFALARFLTENLDQPVVDATGLAPVAWDFDIDKLVSYHEINRDQATDRNETGDYLRSEVQHRLGLKLDSRKENVEMLVIDHIDEPPLR